MDATMWGGIERQELRIFLVLAEELHFGRTAERLLLTQSRVSQSLRALERKIGGRLVERTSRTVSLTPLGRTAREELGTASAQLEAALQRCRQRAVGITGTLRIGLHTPVSGGPALIAAVRAFTTEHPACAVEFITLDLATDPLGALRTGAVDLLVARLPLDAPDVSLGPVLTELPRALVVTRDDPLAGREYVDYDDVGDRVLPHLPAWPASVMDTHVPPVTATGRRVRRAPVSSTEEAMVRVALGDLALLTVQGWLAHHAHPDAVEVPVRDLPPARTALVHLSALTSPRIDAFLTAAAQAG